MYQRVPLWDRGNRKEPLAAGTQPGALPVSEPDKDPLAQQARRSRAARGWANMSTAELAVHLGKKDRKYVERRENGQYAYDPGDLLTIAKVTGAPEEFMQDAAGWKALVPTVREEAAKAARKIAAAHARKQQSNGQAPAKEVGDSEPNRSPEA